VKTKLICLILGFAGFICGNLFASVCMGVCFWFIDEYSDVTIPFFLLICSPCLTFLAGILLGWMVTRWYTRKRSIVWLFGPGVRVFAVILVALYLLTWTFGAPRVQSENNRWALEEWKRIHQENQRRDLRDDLPYIDSFVSVPILPFVVATYHEYQLAGLYGAGGWEFQIWYVFGVRSLFFQRIWVS